MTSKEYFQFRGNTIVRDSVVAVSCVDAGEDANFCFTVMLHGGHEITVCDGSKTQSEEAREAFLSKWCGYV